MKFLKQTDFTENKQISKYGCLFIALLTIAQMIVKKSLTREEIMIIDKHVIKQKYMKKSCWVLNHGAIINEGLSFLVEPYKRAKYIGAHYIGKRAKDSWGKIEGDFIILEVETLNNNGHFRLISFDPYEPSPEYDAIKSLRYYEIKEGKK